MKTMIILFASIALLASCEKQTVKNTGTTTPPLTIGETQTLLYGGIWHEDSIAYYHANNRDSSHVYTTTYMTFSSEGCNVYFPNVGFQFTFISPTQLQLMNFNPYTLSSFISGQSQIEIIEITSNKLILKCVQYINNGQPYHYDIRYLRR